MKKLLVSLLLAYTCLNLSAKTALVIIAHGSPSEEWNRCVLDIESRLNQTDIPGISYKRVALMEFTQPDIASVIRDCELEQIDTVFALPLFISPSGHSEDDIPNILGLKYNPAVHGELVEEGTEFVKTPIHIILGPTLMDSGVIEKAILERVRELSSNPKGEAVLLLAHGDANRIGFWNHILKNCEDAVRRAGFDHIDCKLVGMGQSLKQDITPFLEHAGSVKDRVLVQGIYLVSSAGSMARMVGMDASSDILYGEDGILPKSLDDVMAWIEKAAKSWLAQR